MSQRRVSCLGEWMFPVGWYRWNCTRLSLRAASALGCRVMSYTGRGSLLTAHHRWERLESFGMRPVWLEVNLLAVALGRYVEVSSVVPIPLRPFGFSLRPLAARSSPANLSLHNSTFGSTPTMRTAFSVLNEQRQCHHPTRNGGALPVLPFFYLVDYFLRVSVYYYCSMGTPFLRSGIGWHALEAIMADQVFLIL